jgi:phage gp36-like protein
MIDFSAQKQAERLLGIFTPIFTFWQKAPVMDPHLREVAGDRDLFAILQQDMTDIGLYFATADALGSRAEFALVADYLLHLRADPPASAALHDAAVSKLTGQLEARFSEGNEPPPETIHAPLCWRIAQICLVKHHYSQDAVMALRDALLRIADHLLLHDGNITPAEDIRLKAFHAALN